MATQFRDTQCGHLIRFLTGDKMLQHPDEIDPEPCCAALASRTSKKGSNTSAEAQKELEADKETGVLVDWYGADDPEVRSAPYLPPTRYWFADADDGIRTLRTGPQAGNSS